MAKRGDAKPAGWGRVGGRPRAARALCGRDRGRTPRPLWDPGSVLFPDWPPDHPAPEGGPGTAAESVAACERRPITAATCGNDGIPGQSAGPEGAGPRGAGPGRGTGQWGWGGVPRLHPLLSPQDRGRPKAAASAAGDGFTSSAFLILI